MARLMTENCGTLRREQVGAARTLCSLLENRERRQPFGGKLARQRLGARVAPSAPQHGLPWRQRVEHDRHH
jgi:hypothetical protein